jgi:hypothetical protein
MMFPFYGHRTSVVGYAEPALYVFSKCAAFFNSLKSKVGHIMAKASALRVNLNLAPSIPSTPRPPTRKSHAHLLYALNLAHQVLSPHGA